MILERIARNGKNSFGVIAEGSGAQGRSVLNFAEPGDEIRATIRPRIFKTACQSSNN